MATVVKLDPTVDEAVKALVDGGHFESADEVIRTGVRLVQARERMLEKLDAAIEQGLADVAAGRVSSVEDVEARLLAKIRSRTAAE